MRSKIVGQGFFFNFGKGPFRLGKFERKPLNWEICYSAQLQHFRLIKKNKLALTHTIAIKLKEK